MRSPSRGNDLALDAAAKAAAIAVRRAGSGRAAERFLIRFADYLNAEDHPADTRRLSPFGKADGKRDFNP
jgi:hypothetical protein